jgi:hypothetical protein
MTVHDDDALGEAERDLAEAKKDLGRAEGELEKAVEAVERAEEHREFKVEVSYNGVNKGFEVRAEELVSKLLQQAIEKFGPIPAPHTMALYNASGNELTDSLTIKAAAIKPGDHLLLRPSKVKGG